MKNGTASHWPRDGSLPPHVAEYVDWLVTPEWEKPDNMKTLVAWAAAHDVRADHAGKWKNDYRVKTAIAKRCDELNLAPDKIQEVIAAVHRAAVRGDMKAAALYMQHADKLQPKRIVIEDGGLAKLSDAELRERLAAVLDVDD